MLKIPKKNKIGLIVLWKEWKIVYNNLNIKKNITTLKKIDKKVTDAIGPFP